MTKKDLINIFIDEVYNKSPSKNYPNIKAVYKYIDEKWSIDLADFLEYKTSNYKGYT